VHKVRRVDTYRHTDKARQEQRHGRQRCVPRHRFYTCTDCSVWLVSGVFFFCRYTNTSCVRICQEEHMIVKPRPVRNSNGVQKQAGGSGGGGGGGCDCRVLCNVTAAHETHMQHACMSKPVLRSAAWLRAGPLFYRQKRILMKNKQNKNKKRVSKSVTREGRSRHLPHGTGDVESLF